MASTGVPSRRGKKTADAARPETKFRVVRSEGVAAIIDELQRGLPYQRLTLFEKRSGLPLETISHVIRVPKRTLARRKASGHLAPDESERLHRLSTLFEKAVHLFAGDYERAKRWFESPMKALGQVTPLEMAGTEVGARAVEDLIGRLEHGVFT